MIRRLYERLKAGGKTRYFFSMWMLYWGGVLGFIILKKEEIIGTNPEETQIYTAVYAAMAVLCLFGWLMTILGYGRKSNSPALVSAWMLPAMLLNAGWMFFELEYIANTEFFEMEWRFMLLNIGVIFVFCLFLFGILNSLKRAMLVMNIFYFVISLVFYYVYHFRGEAFQLIDLFSIKTAAEVVGGYEFEVTRQMVIGLIGTLIAAGLWKQSRNRVFFRKGKLGKILLRVVTAALMVGFYLFYMHVGWYNYFGIISDLWNPAKTYRQYGTTVGFCAVARYMRLTPPDGYSKGEVERIIREFEEEQAAKPEREKPKVTPVNVIAIMNEAWFDYRTIGDPQTSEPYMPFLDSLTDNIIKGHTLACTKGGGTAKTEYEFLTGNSCKRFPGMVPYVSYFTHDQYSIVTTLKAQGYPAIAMHPNKATNWKRTTAYRFLDFDEFLAFEAFPNTARRYRNMISDKANYEEIVRLYEEKEAGSPLFVFNITMQNHSGYTNKNFKTTVNCDGYDSDEADQYFSLLKLSDDAIQYLVTYFEQVEEPTMIVMFGDHSPKLPDEFETWIAGGKYDDLPVEEQQKYYGTPFFIWTNYEMESQNDVWTSTNFLSSWVLELAGLELAPYNEYLLDLREKIPALNHLGYLSADGTWYRWKDAEEEILELEREYECLQYNELMDRRDRADEFFSVSAH